MTETRTNRCTWVGSDSPLMLEYHDREWGVPVHDDRKHFEFLVRIQTLIADPSIIRNRMKIDAAVRNARAFLAIQDEFGSFDAYCWRFVDGRPRLNRWRAMRDIPPTSGESDAFSKDLKGRGFSFVGSTIIYAHMQAVGMVNDHLVGCFRYRETQRLE